MRSAPDMGTAVLTADDEVVAGRRAAVRIVAGQPIVCGGQEPVDEKRRQSAPSSAGPADVTPQPPALARASSPCSAQSARWSPVTDRHPDADQFDVQTPTMSGPVPLPHRVDPGDTRPGRQPKVLATEFIPGIERRHQPILTPRSDVPL